MSQFEVAILFELTTRVQHAKTRASSLVPFRLDSPSKAVVSNSLGTIGNDDLLGDVGAPGQGVDLDAEEVHLAQVRSGRAGA
jgi:hypothetical protein